MWVKTIEGFFYNSDSKETKTAFEICKLSDERRSYPDPLTMGFLSTVGKGIPFEISDLPSQIKFESRI